MPKISIDKLVPGMKLAKPVINEGGMVLLGAGTELTDSLIDRIAKMNIDKVNIEMTVKPQKPKNEMMAELDDRFRITENKPYMGNLKKLFQEHIEALYK